AVLDPCVGAEQLHLVLAHGLDLRAGQHDPRFIALQDLVVVPGAPVERDGRVAGHSFSGRGERRPVAPKERRRPLNPPSLAPRHCPRRMSIALNTWMSPLST